MLPLLLKYLIGYLGIGLAIIIHEVGHLVVARAVGITVEVFSFGMGPKVKGWMVGKTEVRLSLLPFGGYCRMKGSDDLKRALETRSRTFSSVSEGSLFAVHPFKRFLTYLAGPLFNLLASSLLYALLASLPSSALSTKATVATVDDYPALFGGDGSPAGERGLETGDVVLSLDGEKIDDYQKLEELLSGLRSGFHTFLIDREGETLSLSLSPDESGRWGITNAIAPVVGRVRRGSAEEKAGLLEGDRIRRANGREVENNLDLLCALGGNREVSLTVERDGKMVPVTYVASSGEEGRANYRFSLKAEKIPRRGSRFSLFGGLSSSFRIFRDTVKTLASVVRGRSGDVSRVLTGTGRAALLIGDITTLGLEDDLSSGIRSLLYLIGVVSISLAVGNLLPLPAFDGGQILIALLETLTGRRVPPRSYWILQLIGLACVALLFLSLTFADLRHWRCFRH